MSGPARTDVGAETRVEPIDAVGRAVAERATGLLSVRAGKLRRLFCLENGRLVYAASNVIEEQLDEALVRSGVLTQADRAAARKSAAAAGDKLPLHLRRTGAVPEETLARAASEHYETLLRAALTTKDADTSFERGRPRLDDEITVSRSCLPALLAHTARHPSSLDAVRIKIGPPKLRPRRAAAADELVEGIELDETAAWLASTCDGGREVADVVAAAPGTPEATLRRIYGLLLAGVLEPEVQERQVGTGAGRVSEDELVARLERAEEADHYGVLGLGRDADDEAIRSAYYYLARRYHPDRFRSGALAGMIDRIETYFAKVTEAYNTLIDAERRAAYHEELDRRAASGGDDGEKVDARFLAKQNFLRARTLVGKRQFQAALPFLENAIAQDESQASYHLELGRVLTRAPRRRDEAEAALRRAAELDPADSQIYVALGDLFALQQRPDDAARMYREALRWRPDDSDASERLAALEDDRGGGLLGGLFKGKS